MPSAPLPPELEEFVARPNIAVVATVRRDGSPHTVATWYDWEDGRVLFNLDEGRVRLANMRRDPRVALTVLDDEGEMHVSLLGRVVEIYTDTDLRDIDRLSQRYDGRAWRRRDDHRISVWMRPERWHGWNGPAPLHAPR